jgi:prepilin-type N-terminal cleavage/methylation domain-containing protein
MRRRRGFTLIELMIVVAILGLLASIAISMFRTQVLKAKRRERDVMMSALELQMKDYLTVREQQLPNSFGGGFAYLWAPWNPSYPPTAEKRAFDPTLGDWKSLSFADGNVRYSYQVFAEQFPGWGYFYIYAAGDADGNGLQSFRLIEWETLNGTWTRTADSEWGDAF